MERKTPKAVLDVMYRLNVSEAEVIPMVTTWVSDIETVQRIVRNVAEMNVFKKHNVLANVMGVKVPTDYGASYYEVAFDFGSLFVTVYEDIDGMHIHEIKGRLLNGMFACDVSEEAVHLLSASEMWLYLDEWLEAEREQGKR